MSTIMSRHMIRWETWALAEEDDRRFRRIMLYVGIPALILAIIITLWQFAEEKKPPEEYNGGQQVVELIKTPPAGEKAPPEQPKPAQKDSVKPPEQAPKAVAQVKPQPVPKPEVPKETAREVAQKTKEMQAIQDSLSDLRDKSLNTITSSTPLTTGIVSSKGGAPASGEAIGQSAAANSGGAGTGGLGSVTSTQSGTGLGNRRTGTVQGPASFGRPDQPPGNGKYAGGRSLSEIQEVFDRNKGALQSIYIRAQRESAGMDAGKITISITIAPDGSVTACSVVSSSFNNPDFEQKLRQRIMLFHFLPKAVPPFTYGTYPIDFHPM